MRGCGSYRERRPQERIYRNGRRLTGPETERRVGEEEGKGSGKVMEEEEEDEEGEKKISDKNSYIQITF